MRTVADLRLARRTSGKDDVRYRDSGDARYRWYLLPAVAIFGVFLFAPLLVVIALSFSDWNLIGDNAHFVGLNNYADVILGPRFLQTLWQTALYLILGFAGNCLLPVVLAFLTTKVGKRVLAFYRTALFLPAVVASAVSAIIWQYLFLPAGGPINSLLERAGTTGPNWFTDPDTVIFALSVIASWNTFGFNYIVALGGLSAIPSSVIEAAELDGAHGWHMLSKIILPMASPTLVFIATVSVLQALPHVFVPIQVITGGGPANASNNLFYDVYRNAFQYFRIGQSAAGAVVLIALLSIAVIIQYRITDRWATYGTN